MCTIMTSYSESQGFQIWMMWRQAPGGSDVVIAQALGLGGSDVVMAQVSGLGGSDVVMAQASGLGGMSYGAGTGQISTWLMMEMS